MRNLALGIDIGGTNTSFGLVNRRGEIVVQSRIKTVGHATVADYIEHLKNALDPVLDEAGRTNIIGAGVGAPNANYFTGEIINAANLLWKGVIPIAHLLKEALGMPVTVNNDANAATIGEMTYGAAKGMRDFIMVTLGTGVGSGFVANGQLIYGHDGLAGELGHVIAVRNGRPCGCGRKGCLETYASATGIVQTAREWLQQHDDETMLRSYGDALTARDIHLAGDAGDHAALAVFEQTGEVLGQILADMVAVTSPQAIIFFGGLAKAGKLIIGPTQHAFEENLLSIYRNKVALLPSALRDADAAILGASALVW